MGPKITINIKRGEKLACAVSYEIDNGIRLINAITALEDLVKQIKAKAHDHAVKSGLNEKSSREELRAFFGNQMLEEIF